jgi:WD40 repeat protein
MYLVTYNDGLSIGNIDNGELINSLSVQTTRIKHVAMSPDNTILATVSEISKSVELWNLPALTPRGVIDDSNDCGSYFGQIEFSFDGRLLAGVKVLHREDDDDDDTDNVYDVDGGHDNEYANNDNDNYDENDDGSDTAKGPDFDEGSDHDKASGPLCVYMNVMAAILIAEYVEVDDKDTQAVSTGGLKLWDINSLACISSKGDVDGIGHIMFCRAGNQIAYMKRTACPGLHLELQVWDHVTDVVDTIAEYPNKVMFWDRNFKTACWDVNFGSDICAVISSFTFMRSGIQELSLELREWTQRKVKWTTTAAGDFIAFRVLSCTISADGSNVAVTITKSVIAIFATLDGSTLCRLDTMPWEIRSLHCHPTDPTLIAFHYRDMDDNSCVFVYDWMNVVIRYRICCADYEFKLSKPCNILS